VKERERGEAARCFATATHVQRIGRLAAGCFAAATDREKELETRDRDQSETVKHACKVCVQRGQMVKHAARGTVSKHKKQD
jgi:hypothetical protein